MTTNGNTLILPCGTIIEKVYAFTFENEGQTVNVAFLNYGAYERSGADHSFSSEMRREFGRTILQQHQHDLEQGNPIPKWRPLPDHEYVTKLAENGFEYEFFNICNFQGRIYISIKAKVQENPPLVYSKHFPHLAGRFY